MERSLVAGDRTAFDRLQRDARMIRRIGAIVPPILAVTDMIARRAPDHAGEARGAAGLGFRSGARHPTRTGRSSHNRYWLFRRADGNQCEGTWLAQRASGTDFPRGVPPG
ncbi:hypothetical protein [Paracoccus sp. S1E-3]|uniref:hypothetical protein n=1 Tax=Paracoccus sp. S1E-3 TaxID=2756130 RepID=UPI001C691BA4|nr:hypothetical protein [Paracoccus sp. S1E-3]